MAEDAGVISYTVEADTADLLNAESNAEKFVKTVTTGMKSADAAVDRFKRTMSDLGRTVDDAGDVMTAFGKIDQEATKQLKSLTAQAKLASYQAQGIGTSMTKSAVAVKKFAMQKGGLQNMSYQLQDMVVQAQMGTSAFTILAQQGPQLAMSWGPAGAAIGVVLAVVGALGGVLFKAFDKGTKASDDFAAAQEEVKKAVNATDTSVDGLSDKLIKLSKVSNDAAMSQIAVSMAAAKNEIFSVSQAVEKMSTSFDGFFTGSTFTAATAQLSALDKITERFGVTAQDAFDGKVPAHFVSEISNLSTYTERLAQKFGITQTEALGLTKVMTNFNREPNADNLQSMSTALSTLSNRYGYSNVALNKFTNNINQQNVKIKTAKDSIDILKNALDTLSKGGSLDDFEKSNNDAVESVVSKYQLLIAQMGKTSAEQAIMSAKASMTAKQWEKQGQQITDLINRYYELQKAQDTKTSEKAQTKRETAATEAKIKAVQDQIAVEQVRATEGDKAASMLAAAQKAVGGASSEAGKKLAAYQATLFDLQQQLASTTQATTALKNMETENAKLSDSVNGLSLAEKQELAVKKLGTKATDEQITKAKALAAQNEQLSQQKQGQQISNSVQTSESVTTDYTQSIAALNAYYATGQQTHQQYIATKEALDNQYYQNFLSTNSAMSKAALSAVNSLSSGAATAFATIASGSGSATDAMKTLAQTIIQSVLQSLIQTAVQYTLLPALASAFGAAQASAAATSSTATKAAMVSNAATSAAASTTAATAAAPAAAATATWSWGTAALIGAAALGSIFLLSKTLSGGRRYGGGVSSGNTYRVNESGIPEVYSSGGNDYLMATRNASVTPLDQYGSSSGVNLSINNYASDQVSVSASKTSNGYDIDVVTKQVSANLTNQLNNRQGSFATAVKGYTS